MTSLLALSDCLAILRDSVVSVVIHGHVVSVTLRLVIILCAADVWASWVGLLFVKMGRSDTELAAGAEEQLGETGYSLQPKKGQTPLCVTQYVCECTLECATLPEYLS